MKKGKVVIFIFTQNEKILVEKRLLKGFVGEQYLIPGGRVKKWESLEEALRRETKEELGVSILEFTCLQTDKEITGLHGNLLIPFIIQKWQGYIPQVILDRGNPLIWLEFDQVLTTQIIPTRKIVEQLQKHLKENDTSKS